MNTALADQGALGQQPTNPPEGAAIQVRWARLGKPNEVRDEWRPGTYLRTIGHGPDKRFLVRSATPHSPFPITVPATPDSVRFVQQVAA